MRGVWVATVRNIDWPSKPGLTVDRMKAEMINLLDLHKRNGMNCIVFQVRPACDAFYASKLEPWAQWLTGIQGQAPDPFFDPLAFTIRECHKRNMELHAWFNPYRAVTGFETAQIDSTHPSVKHPDWIITYGKNKFLDPGLPETRQHVIGVVADVVRRYDIDAVHMDDYFYPYKIEGEEFSDEATFQKYPRGFSPDEKEDWRRNNVDMLIRQLYDTIHDLKPRVQFGISPFGVWRNSSVDSTGSDTRAKQTNYDDLYADIIKWLKNGWIDYVVPQAYWPIGFEIADHKIISEWWNRNAYGKNLYIGHGVHRFDKHSKYKAWRNSREIEKQVRLSRTETNVSGDFYFSSRVFQKNPVRLNQTFRKKIYPYPALIPLNPSVTGGPPDPPRELHASGQRNAISLKWDKPAAEKGVYYVLYRFPGKTTGDMSDPQGMYKITSHTQVSLRKRFSLFRRNYTFVVTALNRLHYESGPSQAITVRY